MGGLLKGLSNAIALWNRCEGAGEPNKEGGWLVCADDRELIQSQRSFHDERHNPSKIMTGSACDSRIADRGWLCAWKAYSRLDVNLALLFVDFWSEEYLISCLSLKKGPSLGLYFLLGKTFFSLFIRLSLLLCTFSFLWLHVGKKTLAGTLPDHDGMAKPGNYHSV